MVHVYKDEGIRELGDRISLVPRVSKAELYAGGDSLVLGFQAGLERLTSFVLPSHIFKDHLIVNLPFFTKK